jgi:hypothetical protein
MQLYWQLFLQLLLQLLCNRPILVEKHFDDPSFV